MPVPNGVTHEEYERGVCMSKHQSPSLMHALNRGWLMCSKHGSRSAIYQCKVCGLFHNSHLLDGNTTLVCVYTGPAQQEKAA